MSYISLLVKPKEKCYASWTQLFICLHWLEHLFHLYWLYVNVNYNFIVNLSLKASNFRTQTCIRVLSMNTHNTYYVLGYFARCLHHSLKIVHVSVSYYHPLLYIRLIHYRTIIELLQYRMILWNMLYDVSI